jgi:hypothetical protein
VAKKHASRLRRRLSEIRRTSIVSYYTEQEKREIAEAAGVRGVTMSAFVASAALMEAQRIKKYRGPLPKHSKSP